MLFHSMKQSLLFCQIILVILATELNTWFIKLIMSTDLAPQSTLGSRLWSQGALVWPLAMSCLDAKIPLVPKHQLFIVPPTLLAHHPLKNILTEKIQKYICSDHWHMSYFFIFWWSTAALTPSKAMGSNRVEVDFFFWGGGGGGGGGGLFAIA